MNAVWSPVTSYLQSAVLLSVIIDFVQIVCDQFELSWEQRELSSGLNSKNVKVGHLNLIIGPGSHVFYIVLNDVNIFDYTHHGNL